MCEGEGEERRGERENKSGEKRRMPKKMKGGL
jgi:hypothetical protein